MERRADWQTVCAELGDAFGTIIKSTEVKSA